VHALRNAHRLLVPHGTLVDLHPTMPNPRLVAEGRDLGPIHQEPWARVWLRPSERELARAVRRGLFTPLAELTFGVVSLYDDPDELVEEADEWEDGWISARVRNRVLRARPPIERHERLVLRTYRA
jgi:hypothetical protein